jgi:hypothetical protein
MTAILELVQYLIGLVLTILGVNQQIAQTQLLQATSDEAQLINANVVNAIAYLSDATYGLAALKTELDDISALITAQTAELETVIGDPQQAGVSVTLPDHPPDGWGIDLAPGMWGTIDPVTGTSNQDLMSNAGFAGWFNVHFGIQRLNASPEFAFATYDGYGPLDYSPVFPFVDWSLAVPGDDLVDFLNANAPGYSWAYDTDPQGCAVGNASLSPFNRVFTVITGMEFTNWLNAGGGPARFNAASPVPVVWPGLTHVTLGDEVALVDGLVVAGPLDGVIVKISGVAYPTGYYPFGSTKSYTKIGAIVFVDDDGEAEMAQPLGLDDNVICPKAMRRAASAVVRVTGGATGTIQPWTVLYA